MRAEHTPVSPDGEAGAEGGRDAPRDFPESLSSMGSMVTGPQNYRRRFLSPVVEKLSLKLRRKFYLLK